ncbi:tRNA m(1)G37 methyltransferase [Gammaproteobacteria bacterium]
MRIGIITLFPEMFDALHHGVVGRAIHSRTLLLRFWNPRDYALDRHRTVDDRPFGGGPGMVMKVQPLQDAVRAAKATMKAPVVYLSPQGTPITQSRLSTFSQWENMILVAGRYEGIDERFIESEVDYELSIGDYVLSGGELPAMVLIDGVTRLLPGVLGHPASAEQDSFVHGLLDHPHYTRPESYEGREVPKVLLSGDHDTIRRWRLTESVLRTWQRRPDLLEKLDCTEEQRVILTAIKTKG